MDDHGWWKLDVVEYLWRHGNQYKTILVDAHLSQLKLFIYLKISKSSSYAF